MKRVFFATAAASVALAASAAMAQPAAPADDWAGPYVGLNAGGAWGQARMGNTIDPTTNTYFAGSSITQIDASGHRTLNPSGFDGGAQAGVNWQAGPWVYGFEADIDALSLNKSSAVTVGYTCCVGTTYTLNQGAKTDWMFTLRPRIGWADSGWLVYATGGLAVTDVHMTHVFTDTFDTAFENGSTSSTRAGWTLGAGLERKLNANWSLRGEYLYADFGSISSTATENAPGGAGGTSTFHDTQRLNTNIVRIGVNRRF